MIETSANCDRPDGRRANACEQMLKIRRPHAAIHSYTSHFRRALRECRVLCDCEYLCGLRPMPVRILRTARISLIAKVGGRTACGAAFSMLNPRKVCRRKRSFSMDPG